MRYEAFGLGISSEIPIPEFVEGCGTVSVTVRLGAVDWEQPPGATALSWSRAHNSEVCLYWQGVGKFLVCGGTEIIIDPDPGASQDRLRLFLVGAAFGVLLHQRGLLVLHASAVSIAGTAVVFLGIKGAGKSTIAALLHSRAHRLIADDVLAVKLPDGIPVVHPSFPQIKLWPESLHVLGSNALGLSRLHPEFEKLSYPVPETFSAEPLPLHSVFVLERGPEPSCQTLESREALSQLITHWYCNRFEYETLQALGIPSQFVSSTHLISKVPFFLLRYPERLSTMPEVAGLVEKRIATNLERLSSTARSV